MNASPLCTDLDRSLLTDRDHSSMEFLIGQLRRIVSKATFSVVSGRPREAIQQDLIKALELLEEHEDNLHRIRVETVKMLDATNLEDTTELGH